MESVQFSDIFESDSEAEKLGLKLRSYVLDVFPNAEESIYGGSKVKLALYSIGNKKNVICGIQQAKNDSCLLYVHHIDSLTHDRLKFTGKGKNAKSIRFHDQKDVLRDDILWLLREIKEAAPFMN